ncbi:MAG: hypothetical protein LBT84_07555, partial [Spirochaetia bacterium]|nr:hypothetical protein [Spirochaetia bacterium]
MKHGAQTMRVKLIAAAVIAALAAIVICCILLFTGKNTIESAIDDFEDKDYADAINKLNALIPLSDYETSEKIYYYRARALNALANELEDDFDDELKAASLGLEETPKFKKAQAKINGSLEKINSASGADLELILERQKSIIASRGKFYEEFTAKYKGSSLIEDLDFEQLIKTEKTQEGDKPLR